MLREVGDDETIVKWADYDRLIKKAYWFDQIQEWTSKLEHEPVFKELKEEAK